MDALRTDPKKRTEGVWRRYHTAEVEGERNIDIKLASMRNKEFRAHAARLTKPHSRRLQLLDPDAADRVGDDEWRDIVAPAVAKHVVKDWRGIEEIDEKGDIVEVPFSVKKCLEYLRDDDIPFADWVFLGAGADDAFRAELLEQAKGECDALSDGGSNSDGASN